MRRRDDTVVFFSTVQLVVAMILAVVIGSACTSSTSCESRCMGDDACMRALEADGTAGYGETRGDRGVCAGICSALRASRRSTERRYRELGPLPVHACLRPAE